MGRKLARSTGNVSADETAHQGHVQWQPHRPAKQQRGNVAERLSDWEHSRSVSTVQCWLHNSIGLRLRLALTASTQMGAILRKTR